MKISYDIAAGGKISVSHRHCKSYKHISIVSDPVLLPINIIYLILRDTLTAAAPDTIRIPRIIDDIIDEL